MNSRPARSVVVTWTWFRSRCTCQVSLQRLMRRHPLPLTGFLGLVPPLQRYSEVLRLPAAHFAALRFLRLAIPSLRPWFVPPAPDAEPWINRELVGGISSRLARWKRQGLPSSRRNPCDHSPYSSDPGVTRQAEWTMSELPGAAPATDNDEGSPRVLISGLNRTAFDLAVYASQGWSPTRHARLASGCWSGSTGRDWLPAGFHLKGFKLRLSSSPELLASFSARCRFIFSGKNDELTPDFLSATRNQRSKALTICGYKDRRGDAPRRAEQARRRRAAASTSCWTCCGPVCGGRAYRWAPELMMHSFAEPLTPSGTDQEFSAILDHLESTTGFGFFLVSIPKSDSRTSPSSSSSSRTRRESRSASLF